MTKSSTENLADCLRRLADPVYREEALRRDTIKIETELAAAKKRVAENKHRNSGIYIPEN